MLPGVEVVDLETRGDGHRREEEEEVDVEVEVEVEVEGDRYLEVISLDLVLREPTTPLSLSEGNRGGLAVFA